MVESTSLCLKWAKFCMIEVVEVRISKGRHGTFRVTDSSARQPCAIGFLASFHAPSQVMTRDLDGGFKISVFELFLVNWIANHSLSPSPRDGRKAEPHFPSVGRSPHNEGTSNPNCFAMCAPYWTASLAVHAKWCSPTKGRELLASLQKPLHVCASVIWRPRWAIAVMAFGANGRQEMELVPRRSRRMEI